MKTSFTPKERRALGDAGEALRTILRLDSIKLGGSLTTNQSSDYDGAVRSYNETRDAVVELPLLGSDFSEQDLDQAVRSVSNLVKLDEMATRADVARGALRSMGLDALDTVDGLGGTRAADPIRDMITSRERQHDFGFIESEQIRALPWIDPEADNTRAISDFANGTSLYVSDFASRVAMYARTGSPWLGLGTVRISDNGRPLIVPTLTGDVTVYTPGEGTAITASDPTLGTVTVTPTGFKALTYLSRESFDDEDVSITDVLARSHARAIGIAFGTAFTTTVLAGIQNGGTAVPAGGNGTGTPTFVGYEDLIDLEYGRAAPYRGQGSFVMSNGMIKKARKYRDQSGRYLWQPNLASGQPESLDGHGVYEDPGLAAPASATKSVIFGDVGAGLILKATPIRVEMSTDYLFNTDQVAIKTVQRISGAVQDAAALAYLVSFNT